MITEGSGPSLRLRFSLHRGAFDVEIDQRLDLGQAIAMYGPSGSGKTSVLRTIAGLERGASGTVEFDGEQWQNSDNFVPAHKRQVGYVFQDSALFPHLDVRGNLEIAARPRGRPLAFDTDEVIETFAIAHLLDRDPRTLSGGETQRVAIARTLVSQPRLLLMDEPVSSLDTASRRETVEYIAALTEVFRLPLIYVTHDAAEVARLAGMTLLLSAGRVEAYGRTPEVFAQMESVAPGGEAASILEASVSGASDGLTELTVGTQILRLPLAARRRGERVQLRILARDIVLATRRIEDTSIRNILAGRVETVRSLDPGTVEIRIDLEGQILKAHITAIACDALRIESGTSVYAMVKSVALGNAAGGSTQ